MNQILKISNCPQNEILKGKSNKRVQNMCAGNYTMLMKEIKEDL